jgi:hypothetical protein
VFITRRFVGQRPLMPSIEQRKSSSVTISVNTQK